MRRSFVTTVLGNAQFAFAAVFLLTLSVTALPASAQSPECDTSIVVHNDIVIIGFPCPDTSDVSIVPTRTAVQNIVNALEVLRTESPDTFAVIEDLKRAGPVIISYDPYSQTGLTSSVIALFVPWLYADLKSEDTPKLFPVIVSRDGIKWPTRELAAVLGHELMGHGKQHLEDRIDAMRTLDLECEAWLLQEQVHQDLKLDKMSRDMVSFRRQLEQLQCDDFIRYMRKNTPEKAKIWDTQNPDVPELLSIFSGYVDAQRRLGKIADAQAATDRLLEEAIQNAQRSRDPEAYFAVGEFYLSGASRAKDPAAAAGWLRTAAQMGHVGAMVALGELLELGDGVDKNPQLAAKLFTVAAKQGDPDAMYALGVLYETGVGVKHDEGMAKSLYEKAATRYDTRPETIFGMLYLQGTGFPKSPSRAFDLFIKSARMGDPVAQYYVGFQLIEGKGVERNPERAAKWLRASADQGVPLAQNDFADLLRQGRGVQKDLNQAFELYQEAARSNLAIAQSNLANMYLLGLGAPKDYAAALRWYNTAADQGLASAQYGLGLLHEKGWGVQPDFALAREWYAKSAAQGYEAARKRLSNLDGLGA